MSTSARRPSPLRLAPFALLGVLLAPLALVRADDPFRRGDANGTGDVDISDPIALLAFLFSGASAPDCPDAADFNDDGTIDIGDPIYGLGWLFFGTAAPPAPGPRDCGRDPTPDALAPCVDPDCALPPAACIDLSFAPALAASGDSNERAEAEVAADERALTRVHSYLGSRLSDGPGAATVVLESFHTESGVHSFFYARLADDRRTIRAATNLSAVAAPGGLVLSEPGVVREVGVAVDASIEALLARIEGASSTTGVGGDATVLDGTTHFLSYVSSSRCVQHALYGYRLPWIDGRAEPGVRADDVGRYAQTVAAYELWAELFAVLAPAPALAPAGGGAGGATRGLCVPLDFLDADFQQDVLAALQLIAPCWIYEIDFLSGQVTIVSPADFEAFCECYKQHEAGMNLVEDLVLGEGKTTIVPTAGGNVYRPGDDEVGYNPDRTTGGRNADGSRERPPAVGLAHELIHALHDRNGTIDLDGSRTDGVLDEEISTVRGENQIREELGEPVRTHYGANEVPNHTDDHLDESNRADCPCPEEDGEAPVDGEALPGGEDDRVPIDGGDLPGGDGGR